MKIKYMFDCPDYQSYHQGRHIIDNEMHTIYRVHDNELEICFYDDMQKCHRVYIVARDDSKIVHLESNTDEFKENGIDGYVAASLLLVQKDMKEHCFDAVNDNYIDFIKANYELKRGEEGTSESKYKKYNTTSRFPYALLYAGVVTILGIINIIFNIILYHDHPVYWICNAGLYIIIVGVIVLINFLLEKAPKDFLYKGEYKEEKDID